MRRATQGRTRGGADRDAEAASGRRRAEAGLLRAAASGRTGAARALTAGAALLLGLACASGGARTAAPAATPAQLAEPLDPVASQIAVLPDAGVRSESGVVTVTWPADVLFDDGQPSVRPGGEERLRAFAERVAAYGDPVLRVKVHTDVDGSESYSLGLSEDRAERVRVLLVEAGLSPVRVGAAGFGGEFPVAGNDTEQGRARNRRLEIEIHPAGVTQLAPAAPELR